MVDLDAAARDLAERRTEWAFRKWQECLESQVFPSYEPIIHRVSTPSWIEYAFESLSEGGKNENDAKFFVYSKALKFLMFLESVAVDPWWRHSKYLIL